MLNHIKEIQAILEQNDAGFRKQAGTVLKNPVTGEIKLIPPQQPETIVELISNLAEYINDRELDSLDLLVKMVIIHYQFESIHPFYDGNGRTGRIINILYLVLEELLDFPILYLSRYIIKNKTDYYKLLSKVSFEDGLHEWIIFMLKGVESIAKETIEIIKNIELLMDDAKRVIQKQKPKIYSKDLVEVLFFHPYTKISSIQEYLKVTRKTASNYLKELETIGLLSVEKRGREIFYVNIKLYELFKNR